MSSQPSRSPQRIHFLLIPEFSMIALSAVLEPLRVANRFGGDLYEWVLVGKEKGMVPASNGALFQTSSSIHDISQADLVLVCSSFNPRHYQSAQISNWLKQLNHQGSTLGAIDTGIYFLAYSGLVGKEKVTLHWEQLPCFLEEFPDSDISNELFEISPRRMYCCGGTAGTDMMLYKIAMEHGYPLALRISEQFMLSRIREPSEPQRLGVGLRHHIFNKRLASAIAYMENHIENRTNIDDIARKAHISRRQMERLFQTSFGKTPSSFYLELRLKRAQMLLRETNRSITEISVATGFDSVSYFSRSYREFFRQTPRSERELVARHRPHWLSFDQ